MFERSIAGRIKLRKEWFGKIQRKKQNINHSLLIINAPVVCANNSVRQKTEINKTRSDLIKQVLTKSKRITENTPKDDAAKIEGNEKIIDIVKRILEFNNKIQSGQVLKILTPSQMLSR